MTVGIRLKEERKRLGMSQTALALALGCTKRTQILFEQDVHLPGGSYLVEADRIGVDVMFVLTGRREGLSESDIEALEAWRGASASARADALAVLSGARVGATQTVFHGANIGQQISGDVDLRGQKVVVAGAKAKKGAGR